MCSKKIHGSTDRPRLVIIKSNTAISCQLINDDADRKKVLAFFSSKKLDKSKKNCNCATAFKVGEEMGNMINKLGIKKIVIDRAHHIFHGKVKAIAEGVSSTMKN